MAFLPYYSFALRNCTSRSLLIVDEFGKGTEPDDGAGLFCGVVEYLLKLGPQAVSWTTTSIALTGMLTNRMEMLQPRTVFATHFQRVPPSFRHAVMDPWLTFAPPKQTSS